MLRLQLEESLPEPGRFWVRWTPRRWPGPRRPWLDLARGELRVGEGEEDERSWVGRNARRAEDGNWVRRESGVGEESWVGNEGRVGSEGSEAEGRGGEAEGELALDGSGAAAGFELAGGTVDDVLYLPPVAGRRAAAREELARDCRRGGAPVVVQVVPGDATALAAFAEEEAAECVVVVDLLAPLLSGELDALEQAPPGAVAAWPLLPGVTDDPALWEEGCARLAAAGLRQAQAVSVRLAPQDRRWLADHSTAVSYETLFHRESPAERAFDQVAQRHGLAPLAPRPLPRAPQALRGNRRVAGTLALAAELWLRLARPVAQGEAFYRAARLADKTDRDLTALARDGNLAFLGWLDHLSRELVEELAATGECSLLAELRRAYLLSPYPEPLQRF